MPQVPSVEPTPAPAAGVVLDGRYRLESRVGSGATAEVWAAVDERLDRRVAVKVARLDPDDRDAWRRGAAEARLLASLAHPSIVAVHDARIPRDGDLGYVVMELLEGGTLAVALAGGPLAPDRVRTVGATIADALAVVHARGVVHRDVKPANVLFGADGRARLADVGIARVLAEPAQTQVGLVIGTAPYLSPEQVRGRPPTPASDVYALGLVLLECLTGERAYPGPAAESAVARLARRPAVPAAVPADLAALVTAMTADEPYLRPTARAVTDRLAGRTVADLPETAPVAVPPIESPESAPPAAAAPLAPTAVLGVPGPRHRRRWLVAVPFAAVVLTVGGIAYASAGSDGTPPSPAAVAPTTQPTQPVSPTVKPVAVTPAAVVDPTPTPAAGPVGGGPGSGKAKGPPKHDGPGHP